MIYTCTCSYDFALESQFTALAHKSYSSCTHMLRNISWVEPVSFLLKLKTPPTLKGHLCAFHPDEAAIMDAQNNEMNKKRKEKFRVKEAKTREVKKPNLSSPV